MNYKARIRTIEKTIRRTAAAREQVCIRFVYGGGPGALEAAKRGEKNISFDFNGKTPAGPGIGKRAVLFIMPRPGDKLPMGLERELP